MDKQLEVGLEVVTDGEFRRTWWHFDFLEHLNGIEGYVSKEGRPFQGIQTERYNVRNTGKVSFNPDHPFIRDFIELNEIVGGRAVAKQTIPSPNQLFPSWYSIMKIFTRISKRMQKMLFKRIGMQCKAFYEAGVRYLQLDDVYIAGLSHRRSFHSRTGNFQENN